MQFILILNYNLFNKFIIYVNIINDVNITVKPHRQSLATGGEV